MGGKHGLAGLVPGTPQCRRQLLLLAFPPGVFCLDTLFDLGLFGLKGHGSFFVFPLRLVQRRLRSPDELLTLGALLLPCRLFLAALGIAPPLFALELGGGLAGGFLADLGGRSLFRARWALLRSSCGLAAIEVSVGNSACSAKGPFDPAGRLRTTPGLDIVAATTSESSVSLATP